MYRETQFIGHCLRGLERMYIQSEQVFSASYLVKAGRATNLRHRDQEYRYTMNTLMGIHRVRAAGAEVFFDVESCYRHLAAMVAQQSSSVENIAATVWAGRCLGLEVPAEALSLFRGVLESAARSRKLTAQGLAWAIAACAEGTREYWDKANGLARVAIERYIHPHSMLVRHLPAGVRGDWASFAASCYMSYAFLRLARQTADSAVRDIGLRIARTLVKLQGPRGQWAWFYHVPSGRVVDYYPVYSVHQHAMAPFFLLEAIDQGYIEFRDPLVRGFRWVLGENELRQSMVDSQHHVIWRSAIRRETMSRLTRFGRALGVAYVGLPSGIAGMESLRINTECRSYELGWALWAFAGRREFDDILNDASFARTPR